MPPAGLADYIHCLRRRVRPGPEHHGSFKQEAARLCATLSHRAASANAVNTIRFDGRGNIHGDTTDGVGLINDLRLNRQIELGGRKILVLGAGGTVGALLEPLCGQRPGAIFIANRTVSRAEELARKFSNPIDIKAGSYAELSDKKFDLIINATSLSLAGRVAPLPSGILRAGACVL